MIPFLMAGLLATSLTPVATGPCRSPALCFDEAKALVARDPARAVEAYRNMVARFPGTTWSGRAALELGRITQAMNDPAAAEWWSRAEAEAPVLADYALYALSRTLRARQDWPNAAAALESLLAGHPRSLWTLPALYDLGETYIGLADCPRARARWDALVSRYPREPLTVTALVRVADCWISEAHPEQAVPILRRLWWSAPDAPEAPEVTRRLAELATRIPVPGPTADERYQRAVGLAVVARYQAALEEFEAFLRQAPDDPRRDDARLRVAIARIQLRQSQAARHDLTRLADTVVAPEVRLEALGWLARLFVRLDDEAGLVDVIRRFDAHANPRDLRRAQALALLADLYADRQDLTRAIRTFERILAEFSEAGVVEEARWRIGWLHYQTGQFEAAIRTFKQFRRTLPQSALLPQVLYWEGRSHERLGNSHRRQAAALYARLCGDWRHTYYCHQAEPRLMALAGPLGLDPVVALETAPVEDAPRIEERSLPHQDLHYQKARELLVLDWRPEAARELRAAAERVTDGPVLLAVAAVMYEAGDYAFPLKTLQRYYQTHLVRGTVELPPRVRRMAYPLGYVEYAGPVVGGLDSLFVAAIMREESGFDPQAVSRSGAIGLMQVLPPTAQWVARRLGLAPPDRTRLFDQDLNVRLGAAYLVYLASVFGGDPVLVAASYNAGPQAVSQWLQAFQTLGQTLERDEFIERIPFPETRFYVKRVLHSYAEYLRDAARLDKPANRSL